MTLEELAQEIVEKCKDINETEKECPVCGEIVALESSFCKRCGWTFHPIFSDGTTASLNQLFLARSNWKDLNNKDEIAEKQKLQEEVDNLKKLVIELKDDLKRTELNYEKLSKQSSNTIHEITNEKQRLQIQFSAALKDLEAKSKEIASYRK